MFREALEQACRELALSVDLPVLEAAVRYRELLRKWSARISLHSVADDRELARLHFAEAFWAARLVPPGARLADIGSGAGFPGLALALCRPDLTVWLLERNLKKRVFLETAARELGVKVGVAGDAVAWSGWPEVDLATLRALQPAAAWLGRLAEYGVTLIHFRGPASGPPPPGWRCVTEEIYPLSRQRLVSLYQPPGSVPRETLFPVRR